SRGMGGATSGAETRSYGLGNRSRPRRRPSAGTLELASAYRLASERAMGFEPTTSSLGSWHSTTELRPQSIAGHEFPSNLLVAAGLVVTEIRGSRNLLQL